MITQLFFDNRHYFEFRDFLAAQGVTVPIVPGILPILSTSQIKRFVGAVRRATCRPALLAELDRRGDDDEAVTEFGIEYATRQCEELLREGAPGLHFYTLNKARSTTAVVKNLALEHLDAAAVSVVRGWSRIVSRAGGPRCLSQIRAQLRAPRFRPRFRGNRHPDGAARQSVRPAAIR